MKPFSLSHLSDDDLRARLVAAAASERAAGARLLVNLGDIEARQLYRQSGYRSMYGYCVECLRMDESEIPMRLEAARAARRFPAIIDAIAKGRLHEESVMLLAPWLTADSADELMAAAARKTLERIAELLAERYPDLERYGRLRPITPTWDPGLQAARDSWSADPDTSDLPMPPRWFELSVVVTPETRDKLLQAKAVLGDGVDPGDFAAALDRVLTIYLEDHA